MFLYYNKKEFIATVMKLVNIRVSNTRGSDTLRVQVPPVAQYEGF